MIKVLVNGALGRMGSEVVKTVLNRRIWSLLPQSMLSAPIK